MSNVVKKCSCRQCRFGLHTRVGGFKARQRVRAFRHRSKQQLRAGKTPDRVFSLGYTD